MSRTGNAPHLLRIRRVSAALFAHVPAALRQLINPIRPQHPPRHQRLLQLSHLPLCRKLLQRPGKLLTITEIIIFPSS